MNRRAFVAGLMPLAAIAATPIKHESNDVPQAFDIVKKAIQEDDMYAWGWHCNIAMASIDEGMDRDAAQRAASRVMFSAFGVDTVALGKKHGWL